MCHMSVAIYVVLYHLVIKFKQGGCLKKRQILPAGFGEHEKKFRPYSKIGIRKPYIEIQNWKWENVY